MEEKIFKSRISITWLLLVGVLLGAIGYSASIFYGSFFNFASYIFIGTFVLMVFAYRSIYYVLTDKEIQIYYLWGICGKPIGRIYITAITSVYRSYNLFSGPAGSMKRLHFHFKKGYKWHLFFTNSPFVIIPLLSISPVREQKFLEMLKEINPNIQIKVNDKKGWWRFWDWDF